MDSSLCPWKAVSNQPLADHQYLSHLLNVGGGTGVTKLVLEGSEGENDVVELFTKLERDITGLKVLEVKGDSWTQGDQLFQSVASVVSRSELHKLWLDLREERVEVLQPIQWSHLRDLHIRIDKECMATGVLKALVEGTNKMPGRIGLEHFSFGSSSDTIITAEQAELLRSFVASTLLKTLELSLYVASAHMVSVLKAADLSQMEEVAMSTKWYSKEQEGSVLEYLKTGTSLRKAVFGQLDVTHLLRG